MGDGPDHLVQLKSVHRRMDGGERNNAHGATWHGGSACALDMDKTEDFFIEFQCPYICCSQVIVYRNSDQNIVPIEFLWGRSGEGDLAVTFENERLCVCLCVVLSMQEYHLINRLSETELDRYAVSNLTSKCELAQRRVCIYFILIFQDAILYEDSEVAIRGTDSSVSVSFLLMDQSSCNVMWRGKYRSL